MVECLLSKLESLSSNHTPTKKQKQTKKATRAKWTEGVP
jgi:hypothetical protein